MAKRMKKAEITPITGPKKESLRKLEISIPRPDFRVARFQIVGTAPLVEHAFGEKARKQMLAGQMGGAVKGSERPPRDPQAEFETAIHRHPEGGYGFPAAGFRLAMISACRMVEGLAMTKATQLFRCVDRMVKLECGDPEMDERVARLDNGVAYVVFRPLFWPWGCKLDIRFLATSMTEQDLANLLLYAGEGVGIGEMRPEKKGDYGTFTIGS